jgi:CubicO group peptidase (beta-lactamase class C family)
MVGWSLLWLLAGTIPSTDWHGAARVLERAIGRRLFPGAVLVVGRSDTVLYASGFGRLEWKGSARRPDPAATLWDLASLTKVVATTSAVMTLVDRGRVDLDQPVARYLPEFGSGNDKERVTIRMLLDHTSGLPSYRPLYQSAATREEAAAGALAVPLEAAPGARMRYSDLNAIVLGLLVERLAGTSLDQFAEQNVFHRLGMRRTVFAPGVADQTNVAPSIAHRGLAAPGEVNDRNALALGGVAGHAGLFATGLDLARYAQAWLRGDRLGDTTWIQPSTIRRFLARGDRSGTRVLGWDTPDLDHPDKSPFGRLATPSMFGHTGWTGTFLWFDPARDLFLVLLTNRSLGPNTGRSLRSMRQLRAELSDVVAQVVPARCSAVPAVAC